MSFWEAALAALGGVKLSVLVSAIFGGFVSLNFFEGPKDAEGRVLPIATERKWAVAISGAAIGIYGAGPIVDYLASEAPSFTARGLDRIEVGIGFFLALFGMSLVAALIKAIPELLADVRKKLGGGS